MKAVVIGGSGATGKFLVEELLTSSQYDEVVLLLRKVSFPEHPKLKQVVIDFDKLNEVEIKADVAFSCLGTTLKAAGSKEAQWKVDVDYQLNFAKSAKAQGVTHFVLVSAINANSKSNVFYSKLKGVLEEAIISLDFKHTYIFKPSILIRPDSKRLGEKIGSSISVFLEKIGLLKRYAPTHVKALGKAMATCISQHEDKVNYFDVQSVKVLNKDA